MQSRNTEFLTLQNPISRLLLASKILSALRCYTILMYVLSSWDKIKFKACTKQYVRQTLSSYQSFSFSDKISRNRQTPVGTHKYDIMIQPVLNFRTTCRRLRSWFFCDVAWRRSVVCARRFGKTYLSHLQGSSGPRRIVFGVLGT
jgi:hypothetical protein